MNALIVALRSAVGLAMAAISVASIAQSDPYPSRAVRLVVGFPPGSASDVAARQVAQRLTIDAGQTFIVENRPGASGVIAAEMVAKAPPDGYTLWVGTTSEVAINRPGGMKVHYDPQKDYIPTALLFTTNPVLLASNASGFRTTNDLVAAAKARPQTVNIAAVNAFQQVVVASFEKAANVKLNVVYYKGTGLALNDLMGNQIDGMIGYPSESIGAVNAGKARALAIVGRKRNEYLAQTPTMQEAGVPVPELLVWGGVFAPAGTPPDVVTWLNRHFVAAGQSADIKAAAARTGWEIQPWNQATFKAFVDTEIAKWDKVVHDSGVRLD